MQTPTSMSISRIHMDPTIYADPYSFWPDRWLGSPKHRASLEKSLVPFGRGARMCVGQKWVTIFVHCTALHHPLLHSSLPLLLFLILPPALLRQTTFSRLIVRSTLQLRMGGTVDLHRHLIPTIRVRACRCGSGTRYRCPARLFLGPA